MASLPEEGVDISGSINRFRNNKYDVSTHSYPADLMGSEAYGGNYAIFYINVNIDSKLLSENGGGAEITDDLTFTRERGALIAADLGAIGLVGGAVTGVALQVGVAGALASGGSRFVGAIKGATVAAAPGAIGLGAAASVAGSTNRQQKRLKSAIALHIPNQLNIRYGVHYSEEDTATAVMSPILGDAAVKAIMSFSGGELLETVKEGTAALGLAFGPNSGTVSAATGLAFNPRKEQVFKGVDFRTFQIEYQFFPRSSKESKDVLNIIKMFKIHMHPEFKDSNKFLYIYPSEFDITYFSNGIENTSIHKHTSCVLTEMNINYTPNSQFTAFPDGTPTQINMMLTFRELALLDKEMLAGGM